MTSDALSLPALKVTCTVSDCAADLHCFKFHSRKMRPADRGHCRSCGIDLVDWERLHTRNIDDVDHTFTELKQEFIRHYFWHKDIDERADKHARRKGRILLEQAVHRRLLSSIGRPEPFRDGQQTPKSGNIIFYAQHATATCCRTCLEYWHGISKGRKLTKPEINYGAQLAMRFITERMPYLPDDPESIPRKYHARKAIKKRAV